MLIFPVDSHLGKAEYDSHFFRFYDRGLKFSHLKSNRISYRELEHAGARKVPVIIEDSQCTLQLEFIEDWQSSFHKQYNVGMEKQVMWLLELNFVQKALL